MFHLGEQYVLIPLLLLRLLVDHPLATIVPSSPLGVSPPPLLTNERRRQMWEKSQLRLYSLSFLPNPANLFYVRSIGHDKMFCVLSFLYLHVWVHLCIRLRKRRHAKTNNNLKGMFGPKRTRTCLLILPKWSRNGSFAGLKSTWAAGKKRKTKCFFFLLSSLVCLCLFVNYPNTYHLPSLFFITIRT